jgi:hypothetical protein
MDPNLESGSPVSRRADLRDTNSRKKKRGGGTPPTFKRSILRLIAGLALCVGAPANFAAEALRPWNQYRTIMWVGGTAYKQPEKIPLFFERMREMGIGSVTVHGDVSAKPAIANGFPYYVENIVNRGLCLKFSSNVKDWDKFIRGWMEGGRPEAALVRDYSFDDPEWRGWARQQMEAAVRRHHGNAPFAYDIRDELSTTISANPFDYDFGPQAVAGFRTWLKTQYKDLAALNAEWATQFPTWDEVKPFTTDQIKQRMGTGVTGPEAKVDRAVVRRVTFDAAKARAEPVRWNFAPWADFRTYMDISLATTLDELRRTAHAIDPLTPVGVEGTQMPSAFGGYDLWRLAQALDWVEPYDIGNAREILGSFMPGKPILTTVFEKETRAAQRRLWHLLLEGDRGCLVWWSEDSIDWKSEDYALTPKGRALAPVLHELQSPLGRLFLRAERETDPIYLVYSQPSIQVDWLLESIPDGATWPRRFSSLEARVNRLAQHRAAWVKLWQDLGYTPQFVAAEKIGAITAGRDRTAVLVLSDAHALSATELEAIGQFAAAKSGSQGGRVVQDAPAGVFDEHGRLQSKPGVLGQELAAGAVAVHGGGNRATYEARVAEFGRTRLTGDHSALYRWAEKELPVSRAVTVPPETHTRVHRYRLGAARLLAFERNIVYHMSEELKQAGGNEPLERPVDLVAKLESPAHVYDLRTQRYLGRSDQITFTLDPWQPSLFALLPDRAEGDVVAKLLAEK